MNALRPFDVIGLLEPLRRYARALTRNDTQAEDLVQSALLRAYERQDTFRPDASLKAWLFSILHNVFVDERRRESTEKRHAAATTEVDLAQLTSDQETHLRLRQTEKLFNRLPDEQRAALYLVAVDGQTYEAAAASLNIPVGTLMSRLGRARAAMRQWEDGQSPAKPILRSVGKGGERDG